MTTITTIPSSFPLPVSVSQRTATSSPIVASSHWRDGTVATERSTSIFIPQRRLIKISRPSAYRRWSIVISNRLVIVSRSPSVLRIPWRPVVVSDWLIVIPSVFWVSRSIWVISSEVSSFPTTMRRNGVVWVHVRVVRYECVSCCRGLTTV